MNCIFLKKVFVTIKSLDRKTSVFFSRKLQFELSIAWHEQSKDLVVQLTDEKNLLVLWRLRLTQDDYEIMKCQQGFLVDLTGFTKHLVALLELCLSEEIHETPRYMLQLVAGRDFWTLVVLEANPFKHIVHLSLKLVSCSDSDVIDLLAVCCDQTGYSEPSRQHLAAQSFELNTQLCLATCLNVDCPQAELVPVQILDVLEVRCAALESVQHGLVEENLKLKCAFNDTRRLIDASNEALERARHDDAKMRRDRDQISTAHIAQTSQLHCLENKFVALEQQIGDQIGLFERSLDTLRVEQETRRRLSDKCVVGHRKCALLERSFQSTSEDLSKADDVVKKMRSHVRKYHSKLTLRSKAAIEQEMRLEEMQRALAVLRNELSDAQRDFHDEQSVADGSRKQLDMLARDLSESEELLKTQEKEIRSLNKILSVKQLRFDAKSSSCGRDVDEAMMPPDKLKVKEEDLQFKYLPLRGGGAARCFSSMETACADRDMSAYSLLCSAYFPNMQ